jgi:hypothetical protein
LTPGCKVKSNAPRLASISITPESASIAGGAKQQLYAAGIYSDATATNLTLSVEWSSSDPVVTISPTGLVVAGMVNAATPCTITAVEPGGVVGSTVLTVRNLPLASIAVTPAAPPTIDQGTFTQFTATGLFSDGSESFTQDLSSTVTWTVTPSFVADIDPLGKATGKAAGTAAVAAAWSGVTSNSATVTVSGMALQSLTLDPQNDSIYHTKISYFTASAVFSDGVTASAPQDVTESVVWSSSDPSIVTISQYKPGVGMGVYAVNLGSATITATLGSVTGSTPVDVVKGGMY